jgi:hypothetical protein
MRKETFRFHRLRPEQPFSADPCGPGVLRPAAFFKIPVNDFVNSVFAAKSAYNKTLGRRNRCAPD